MSEIGPWKREEGIDRWEDRGNGYRQCSFCGGMHPDDATALVKAGAQIDCTTKSYKRYLFGPGIKGPAKVYVQHFSKEQVDAFNAAITARAKPTAPPGGPTVNPG